MTIDRRRRQRLLKLMSALADDQLDGLQREELAALLRSDPQARKFYIHYTALQSIVRREAAREGALLEIVRLSERDESGSSPGHERIPLAKQARPGRPSTVKWFSTGRWRMAGLAAAVALLAVGLATWNRMPARFEPFDRGVCELIGTEKCIWQQGKHRAIGVHLSSGEQLDLLSGHAELRFESGVQIALDGPSLLRIDSQSSSFLKQGQLVATVPVAGRGFSIVTPSMTVVDLGTEFGIRVDLQGGAEVQVFRGAVNARPTVPVVVTNAPLRLVANQAAVASIEKGLVAVGPIDVVGAKEFRTPGSDRPHAPDPSEADHTREDETRPSLRPADVIVEATGRIRSVSGNIQVLGKPPESVAEQDLKDDRHAFVFLERAAVGLTKDLPVSIISPGRYDNVQAQHGTLPIGTRVDCYLIHFCSPADDAHCNGAIVFTDPIVAIVAGKQVLQATDSVLGAPTTKYVPTGSNRQVEGGDLLELSADRRTLSVDWRIKAGVDQVRVLVASPPNE